MLIMVRNSKRKISKVSASYRGVKANGYTPELESTFFVAPNSTIVGNVVFGNEVIIKKLLQ